MDRIRDLLQQLLDEAGDGWSVSHWFIAVGLERIDDGHLVSGRWWLTPDGQPEYVTDGLLDAVIAARDDTLDDD